MWNEQNAEIEKICGLKSKGCENASKPQIHSSNLQIR